MIDSTHLNKGFCVSMWKADFSAQYRTGKMYEHRIWLKLKKFSIWTLPWFLQIKYSSPWLDCYSTINVGKVQTQTLTNAFFITLAQKQHIKMASDVQHLCHFISIPARNSLSFLALTFNHAETFLKKHFIIM